MNVLKPELLLAIQTLLNRGATQREIERFTGVDRKTIRRYQRLANSPGVATGSEGGDAQIPPPRPPALEGAPPLATSAAPERKLGQFENLKPQGGSYTRLHRSSAYRWAAG